MCAFAGVKRANTPGHQRHHQARDGNGAYREQRGHQYHTGEIFAHQPTIGIVCALILGVGMCLSMKVIGDGSTAQFVGGVVLGIIGLAGICANYPLYKKMLARSKAKYAYEIMELAKKISEQ